MRHPFRRKNARIRLLPFYLIVAAGFALAEPTPAGFAVGALLVLAGEALRCWGAGYLVKTERLTVSGPYARMRHPFYFGLLLLAVGFGVAAGGRATPVVIGCFLPVYLLYYLPYKERVEGRRLEQRYGGAYAAYRAAVPIFPPKWTPWKAPAEIGASSPRAWSPRRFRDNSEPGTLIGVAAALVLLALRPLLPA